MQIPAEKQDYAIDARHVRHHRAALRFLHARVFLRHGPRMEACRLETGAVAERPLVLDLASGTGDFSLLVEAQYPGARPIAVDLTEGMLRLARERGVERAVCGDACQLPFPDAAFDCVFIGYGLRNFPCLATAVREIERIIRPGGVMVSLDFFLPANGVLRRLFLAYLYMQGFLFGLLMHGRPRIYTYIPDSLRSFVSIDDFSQCCWGAAATPE
jgi:demethylmenaquinone methyltransferase / 2-methoxy-6-polyprenyl-1,4-benzoquinol methylase